MTLISNRLVFAPAALVAPSAPIQQRKNVPRAPFARNVNPRVADEERGSTRRYPITLVCPGGGANLRASFGSAPRRPLRNG
jgi:hypothetical protein